MLNRVYQQNEISQLEKNILVDLETLLGNFLQFRATFDQQHLLTLREIETITFSLFMENDVTLKKYCLIKCVECRGSAFTITNTVSPNDLVIVICLSRRFPT